MNLILLNQEQLLASDKARLNERQSKHVRETLKAKPGDMLSAGIENGLMGKARILSISGENIDIALELEETAPEALPLSLYLALPRPKMLRRILQHAASLGIKDIVLLNAWKVEKSYWQTPWLQQEAIEENLKLGLEQSKDTLIPQVRLEKRFKPFVEDRLPDLIRNKLALLAHPSGSERMPRDINEPSALAIGPEGGFTEYEVSMLIQAGFQSASVGPRILRVETAVPAIVGRLYCD